MEHIKLYEGFINTKYLKLQRCQSGDIEDIWDFRSFNGQHGEGIYCFLYGDKAMEEYYSKNGEQTHTFKVDTKYVKNMSKKNWDFWDAKAYMAQNPQFKVFIFNHIGSGIPTSKEVLITDPEVIILE